MSGPSDRAVEAAWQCAATEDGTLNVSAILAAAHDPALGEDASARFGDVLDWLNQHGATVRSGAFRVSAADEIEREHREGRL